MILICAVAVLTGLSVGKIYLDMTTAPTGLDAMDTDFQASEADVLSLYSRSEDASVTEFTGMELWQIAEYKLSLQDKFIREMTGKVVSAGVPVEMRSLKVKNGDVLTYEKLSPSKNVVGISTPNICSLITYNYKTPNKIYINANGTFKSGEKLDGEFSGLGEVYTQAEYASIFHTAPNRSIMPFIISNKTCDDTCFSSVNDNGDGTYNFEINLSGDSLEKAALYYSYEILFSSGYSLPEWQSVKMVVTIDSNFLFQKVTYEESYTVYNAPVIGKAGVSDKFVDDFTYGEAVVA